MLDVHVLVDYQEDLNMKTEYNSPAGVIRFRDFEKGLGIKVLKYALSTSGTGSLVDKAYFSTLCPRTTRWMLAQRRYLQTPHLFG